MYTTADTESRFLDLERRCARLRLWCVALSAVLATACVTAAIAPEKHVMQARRFEVVSSDGKVLAFLADEMRPGWGPGLQLGSDEDGANASLAIAPAEVGKPSMEDAVVLHLEARDPSTKEFSVATLVASSAGSLAQVGFDDRWATQMGADKKGTWLRSYDDAEDDEEEQDAKPRMTFELVDDKPLIRATDRSGKVILQQP